MYFTAARFSVTQITEILTLGERHEMAAEYSLPFIK